MDFQKILHLLQNRINPILSNMKSVKVFIAYSSKDLEFKKELKSHLKPLVRSKRIVVMDNHAINPGENWDDKIGQMLEQSDLVLLLLSADALASPHFFKETKMAIEQRRQGLTDVIPVKLRPCDLEDEPLLQELNLLEVLPEKDTPVVKWTHRDDAYLSIVRGLKKLLPVREAAIIAREQSEMERKTNNKGWEREKASALLDRLQDSMILVNRGDFIMGGDLRGEGKPKHKVNVTSFFIAKYPVTREQWRFVMPDDSSRPYGDMSKPAVYVSWEKAKKFIEKLNAITGRNYRLPTEAEWEYAARGREKRRKYYEFAGGTTLAKVGWFEKNSSDSTQPVGKREPNILGLHDMSGNVWEWCEDEWHDDFKNAPENSKAWENGDKDSRVVKGGSYKVSEARCRVGVREKMRIKTTSSDIGFRLAHDYPM
jgi:formylglycine-generating enzyme required for sulfatase activity